MTNGSDDKIWQQPSFQRTRMPMNRLSKGPAYLHRLFHWLGGYSGITLLALALLIGAVWGFVELADEVLEGETRALEEKLLLAMRNAEDLSDPLGPLWLEEMGRDFTALGGVGVLTLLTLSSLGFLLLRRQFHACLYIGVAVGGAILISSLLKTGFDRPRPDLVAYGSYVYTSSFPSGHSMMASAVYFTLAALLASLELSGRVRAYLLAIAALFSFLVGISRVYLGVHWPTDVLAGWTAGIAWALLCWLVGQQLQRQRLIEKPK
jgi:undecaprenyl-diphosphatase